MPGDVRDRATLALCSICFSFKPYRNPTPFTMPCLFSDITLQKNNIKTCKMSKTLQKKSNKSKNENTKYKILLKSFREISFLLFLFYA